MTRMNEKVFYNHEKFLFFRLWLLNEGQNEIHCMIRIHNIHVFSHEAVPV